MLSKAFHLSNPEWLPLKDIGKKYSNVLNVVNGLFPVSETSKKNSKIQLPWDDLSAQEQDALRSDILNLSKDKNNFMTEIPENSNFQFSMSDFVPIASILLKLDPTLAQIRYELVPKIIPEETFFKRYSFKIWILQQKYTADYSISQLNSTLEEILDPGTVSNEANPSLHQWNEEWLESGIDS